MNNTTIRAADDRNETGRPATPTMEADKTLTSVFDYRSPNKSNHDVNETMKALTEMPDYQAADERPNNQPTTSTYGTANTENRKVHINGCHTLLSLALSMPSRMGETVRPSSIVSFLLHIANENVCLVFLSLFFQTHSKFSELANCSRSIKAILDV